MNCNEFHNFYMNQDLKNEIPHSLSLHLNECAQCRKLFIKNAQINTRIASSAPYISPLHASAIMQNILADDPEYAAETPVRPWLIAGFMLILGVFITGNSNNFSWMRINGGDTFEIIMEFVLGIFISGYIFIFVMTHMKKAKSIMENGRYRATLHR
jgi:predicted anti-sigma-YlaC factor YlaD